MLGVEKKGLSAHVDSLTEQSDRIWMSLLRDRPPSLSSSLFNLCEFGQLRLRL